MPSKIEQWKQRDGEIRSNQVALDNEINQECELKVKRMGSGEEVLARYQLTGNKFSIYQPGSDKVQVDLTADQFKSLLAWGEELTKE